MPIAFVSCRAISLNHATRSVVITSECPVTREETKFREWEHQAIASAVSGTFVHVEDFAPIAIGQVPTVGQGLLVRRLAVRQESMVTPSDSLVFAVGGLLLESLFRAYLSPLALELFE